MTAHAEENGPRLVLIVERAGVPSGVTLQHHDQYELPFGGQPVRLGQRSSDARPLLPLSPRRRLVKDRWAADRDGGPSPQLRSHPNSAWRGLPTCRATAAPPACTPSLTCGCSIPGARTAARAALGAAPRPRALPAVAAGRPAVQAVHGLPDRRRACAPADRLCAAPHRAAGVTHSQADALAVRSHAHRRPRVEQPS